MGTKPKITIRLVEKRGAGICHHGHKPGDSFDFDTERGKLCPMVQHVAFPYIDILRYGGQVPCSKQDGRMLFSCPDCDVLNIFELIRRE